MIDDWTHKIRTSAFGTLLVFLLVPAAVAHADDKDTDFTNYLAAHGIRLGTVAQTGNMARMMCQDLDSGLTQTDEVKRVDGSPS